MGKESDKEKGFDNALIFSLVLCLLSVLGMILAKVINSSAVLYISISLLITSIVGMAICSTVSCCDSAVEDGFKMKGGGNE